MKTFQAERVTSVGQSADILLVEDDPQNAEETIHALEDSGFAGRTELVSDGDEALDYVTSLTLFADPHTVKLPRLILLDLKRPTAGGLHLLRQLRSDERTKGIPTIVMTESKLAIDFGELPSWSEQLSPQATPRPATYRGCRCHRQLLAVLQRTAAALKPTFNAAGRLSRTTKGCDAAARLQNYPC